jgi:hypothetical protein
MNRIFTCAFAILILAFGVFAQKSSVYTPAKGSAERTAILNALRVPVERELKQKISFDIENFRVLGNWAFVSGDPQSPSGGRPDYSRTPYQEAINADMFDNNFFGLLRKSGSRWKVVTYAIGCTDVCYADWWRRHKAPKAIFPYTE